MTTTPTPASTAAELLELADWIADCLDNEECQRAASHLRELAAIKAQQPRKHDCPDWDGLTIAPGDPEMDACTCWPQQPSGVVLTCVYCDHEYPAGTKASGAPILTEHIKVCEKHPMRKLRDALVGLVGADGRKELEQMELAMRLLPAPDADKAVTINAIHALLETCHD